MKKYFAIIGILMFILPMVLAVPQVIRSEIEVTIVNNTIHIETEGQILVSESFDVVIKGNETFNGTINYEINYEKKVDNIFVREVIGNESDLGYLIEQMKQYNKECGQKVTDFEVCKDTNRNMSTLLQNCNQDAGFKSQYESCDVQRIELKSDLDDWEGKKTLYALVIFALGAGGTYAYFKNKGVVPSRINEERDKYSQSEKH